MLFRSLGRIRARRQNRDGVVPSEIAHRVVEFGVVATGVGHVVAARVTARMEGQRQGSEELLFVTRESSGPKSFKHDYHLSNAPPETPLAELARVQKAEHRVEDCLKRAKSEAGLADYEVRTWSGWHHHQALSLIATWFLTEETRRGKKNNGPPEG